MEVVDHRNLLLPREMPDGSVQWAENTDLATKLREGDPTLGWEGDPSLSLVLNTEYDDGDGYVGPRWEVWQRMANGEPAILLWRKGAKLPGPELIRELVAHDTRRVDVAALVQAQNDAVDRAAATDFRDEMEGKADKLAWALGRDLGEPAQDGRPFGLGGGRDHPR